MDSAKNQLTERLKSASNVLVTVSRNPSVDQLSALLGLTLLLNKLGKHAAAVYSGATPSTIEFLQPEATIEKNTDSLRDFIIALDKSKADKLRYKVEDDVVRIFITPYKTSISQDDLEFSQGDFNVDVVVALGVQSQEDLDEAITAHGRILHDATVASVNVTADGGLGSINWHDPQASSLSELVTELAESLGGNLLDNQIATALLTGIVAETERFSNEKTSSQTMSASAALMAAGADQQLVATKLEADEPAPEQKPDDSGQSGAADLAVSDDSPADDGTIEIDHEHDESPPAGETEAAGSDKAPPPAAVDQTESDLELPEPQPADETASEDKPPAPPSGIAAGPKLVTEPPALGGMLTANTQPEGLDPSVDPFSVGGAPAKPILTRDGAPAKPETPALSENMDSDSAGPAAPPALPQDLPPALPANEPPASAPVSQAFEPSAPSAPAVPQTPPEPTDAPGETTLSDIETSVHSPHAEPTTDLATARDEVSRALNADATAQPPPPIAALNAQPLGDDLHPAGLLAPNNPAPPLITPPAIPAPTDTPRVIDPSAPPPVPPPIPFRFDSKPPQS